MPGMDGKGPLGNGPLSGGQRGNCNQTGIDNSDQGQDATGGGVPRQGRGLGRCRGGAGRGFEKGQGKGQGRGGRR